MNLFDELFYKISTQIILTLKGVVHGHLTEEEVEKLKQTNLDGVVPNYHVDNSKLTSENDKFNNIIRKAKIDYDLKGQFKVLSDFNEAVLALDMSDEHKIHKFISKYLDGEGCSFHIVQPINIRLESLILVTEPFDSEWKQPENIQELLDELKVRAETNTALTYVTEVIENIKSITMLIDFMVQVLDESVLEQFTKEHELNRLQEIRETWFRKQPSFEYGDDEWYIDYRPYVVTKLFDEIIYKMEEKL